MRVRKQGLNPFVEVPDAMSRAFARYARSGRIRVEGRLEGARQTTRLYVKGGALPDCRHQRV